MTQLKKRAPANRLLFSVALLAIGMAMGGCLLPPRPEPPMGAAVRATMARQIADPAASERTDSSEGLEGMAGAGAIQDYHRSFSEPKKPSSPFGSIVIESSGSGK
jgi:hypothetical protein